MALAPGTLGAQAPAQDKPDFSGHWMLVSPRKSNDSIARELTVRRTSNELDAPSGVLHVERRFGNSGNIESESLLIGVRSGTVNGISPGSTQAFPSTSSRVSVTWNGSRLVIEKSSYSGPGTAAQHVEEWSLTGKNTLLITMTDRIRGSLQPKTVTVSYRRR
jgi:hypothetical protein